MTTNIDQLRASFARARSASGYGPLTYWAVENVPALLDDNERLVAEVGEWKACLRVNMLRAGFSDQDITDALAAATPTKGLTSE